MSGWDIQPQSVFEILRSISDQVGGEDGTGGLVAKIENNNEKISYANSCAASEPIGTALQEFQDEYSVDLNEMVAIGGRCVTGCSDAVNAYLEGDLEMAEKAQSNAGDISGLDLDDA